MKLSKNIKMKAWFLLGIFSAEMLSPLGVWALTSGPSQPEMHSFEPVTTNQLVDLFSGDFTYNIPLLTVPGPNGGYPINMAYHSGIGMEQEATWVGLGWNLSPGVINRQMRGLPDDFKNASIRKTKYMKPNRTFSIGADLSIDFENVFTGVDQGIGAGMSIMYNNYKGIGIGANFSTTSTITKGNSMVGLSNNFDFSPYSGLGYSPSISLNTNIQDNKNLLSVNIGVQTHAIEGYQGFSMGVKYTKDQTVSEENEELKNEENQSSEDKEDTKKAKEKVKLLSAKRMLQSGVGASARFKAATTFTPTASFPMSNKSITVAVKPGVNAGVFFKPEFNATYSQAKIKDYSQTFRGYGFMNLEHSNDESLIDFNREVRTISKNTRYLPMPNATFDIYQVKGQGIGGVFRPFRPEQVRLHDPSYSESSGFGTNLAAEVAFGAGGYFGADVYFTTTLVEDKVLNGLHGGQGKSNSNPFYEPFYFKASGELSASEPLPGEERAPRVQNMSFRTIQEIEMSPLYHENFYSNYDDFLLTDYDARLADQIGELSVDGPNGSRYVYGIPVYNNVHHEYQTALKSTDKTTHNGIDVAVVTGGHLTTDNGKGTDNFYAHTKIPKYAHSYLLTMLQSQDYVDLTNNGPSEDDLGYYVDFDYEKIADYKWRSPFVYGAYSEARINLNTDDKASINYGEKDLHYLKTIETKSHIAKFTFSDRNDGKGAVGLISNDPANAHDAVGMKKLDRIDLYSKHDQTIPIKTVHFEYDYSLCKGVYNNVNYQAGDETSGKLTLKKVYFTHGNSVKGVLNPYEFTYSDHNYDYSPQRMDRWGNYKLEDMDGMSNKNNPYTSQLNKAVNDTLVDSWNLTKISLPSGGDIEVNYESDDYQFVQDKGAQQMMHITEINYDSGKVTFEYDPSQLGDTGVSGFTNGITDVYFKVYNKLKLFPESHPNGSGNAYDYIEGYGTIKEGTTVPEGGNQASFIVDKVKLKNHNVTPFQQAAVHHIKLARQDVLTKPPIEDGSSFNFADGILFSIEFFGQQLETLISGYSNYAYNHHFGEGGQLGSSDYPSFVRLNVANKRKLGGGLRVSDVKVTDNWSITTGGSESTNEYGKRYHYKLEDGSSSGVAENEPVLGDEESALRKAYRGSKNDVLLNDEIYTDKIVAGTAMPGASVGYSRVIEESIHSENLQTGTGKSVYEFYTAKDFPFRYVASNLSKNVQNQSNVSIPPLGGVSFESKSYSQNYHVIKNDMHGKPKATVKYKSHDILFDDSDAAIVYNPDIPFVERTMYHYQSENGELLDMAPVSYGHKKTALASLGVTKDNFIDTKSHYVNSGSVGAQLNIYGLGPILIPSGAPRVDISTSSFESIVKAKYTNKSGILDKVTIEKDGTAVVAKNESFDPRTGRTILVSNTNEFGDKIYDYNIPAHWYYKTMQNASMNYRAELKNMTYQTSANDIKLSGLQESQHIFREGDQVEITYENINTNEIETKLLWVDNIDDIFNSTTGNYTYDVFFHEGNGANVAAFINGNIDLRVLKSGNRNLTAVDAGVMKYAHKLKNIPFMDEVMNELPPMAGLPIDPTSHPIDYYTTGNHGLYRNRLLHTSCEGAAYGGAAAGNQMSTFMNIDGAYDPTAVSATLQASIDQLYPENSLTLIADGASYDPDLLGTLNTSSLNDYFTMAHILLPDQFVTDFNSFGGPYRDLANYNFEYLQETQEMKVSVPHPVVPDSIHEYVCGWVDPMRHFDACVIPIDVAVTVFENDWTDEYIGLNDIYGEAGNLTSSILSPYRYGLKGTWRPKRNYVFQTPRTQSGIDGEGTDIRDDGIYSSFDFFNWKQPESNVNWTWTNEMTKYSPYGYNLEVNNPLGIKSSNLIGHEESLVIASVSNASYYEFGFDGFEEFPADNLYLANDHSTGNLNFVPLYSGDDLPFFAEGHTGARSLQGRSYVAGNITSDIDNATGLSFQPHTEYVVSFWSKTGQINNYAQYATGLNVKIGGNVVPLESEDKIVVDGWQKQEYYFTTGVTGYVEIQFISGPDGVPVYDDVRIHPFNAGMTSNVYDPINYRLKASLDGQNMATMYAYDQEGKLVQVKKETARGIHTLQSSQIHMSPKY